VGGLSELAIAVTPGKDSIHIYGGCRCEDELVAWKEVG